MRFSGVFQKVSSSGGEKGEVEKTRTSEVTLSNFIILHKAGPIFIFKLCLCGLF